MNKPLVIWVLISLFLLSCTSTSKAPQTDMKGQLKAGEITQFVGEASAIQNGKSRNLESGSELYQGDLVQTTAATRLKIRMIDDAEIILGDNSSLLVERYSFNRKTGSGRSDFKIVKGVFHSRSGRIAKAQPKRFRIKTAYASIAVKGTEFWGGFWENGDFDVALLKGTGVTISNSAGTVEIDNIGWGTTLVSDTIAPTTPKKWGTAKLNKAVATVAWK